MHGLSPNQELVKALAQRDVNSYDLEDDVLALIHEQNSKLISDMPSAAAGAIMQSMAAEARKLTRAGLLAQVEFMDGYYKNRESLTLALAGFTNLPLAA